MVNLLSKAQPEIYITFRAIKQKNNESIKKLLRSSIQHISLWCIDKLNKIWKYLSKTRGASKEIYFEMYIKQEIFAV